MRRYFPKSLLKQNLPRHHKILEDVAKKSKDNKFEFDLMPRKHHFYYKQQITKHAKFEGRAGADTALKLLEEMKRSGLDPKKGNYSPVITACAKAGYMKKAFELYKDGLKYFDKPTHSMVTSLINACSLSEDKEDGIKTLESFELELKSNYGIEFNRSQNHARIKAYCLLGCADRAKTVLNDMRGHGQIPDLYTYNTLFFACTSNQESGLLQAIMLYRKIRSLMYTPDINTYRHLIHCVRFCNVGSQKYLEKVLSNELILTQTSDMKSLRTVDKKLPSLIDDNIANISNNLLAIDVTKMPTPWDRLGLLGGLEGFLEAMVKDRVKPDFRIFYHIVTIMPQTPENQLSIYHLYKKHSIDNNVVFYELLVRNICHNAYDKGRLKRAQFIIDQMHMNNLKPTLTIFEMLAFACHSKRLAQKLISDIETSGLVVSERLILNLFYCANYSKDIEYMDWLVELARERQVESNETVIGRVENFYKKLRERIASERKKVADDQAKQIN